MTNVFSCFMNNVKKYGKTYMMKKIKISEERIPDPSRQKKSHRVKKKGEKKFFSLPLSSIRNLDPGAYLLAS